MRHIFFSILIISIIGIFCSCEKDDNNYKDDETKKEYYSIKEDNTKIEGIWNASFDIDSIVFIFKNNTMIEYVYEKNTKLLIDRFDYGKYSLLYYPNTDKYIISFYNEYNGYSSAKYLLRDNILTLYKNYDSPIDYKKIE